MADVLGKFMKPKNHSDEPAAELQPPQALSVPHVPAKEQTPVLSKHHDPTKEALPAIATPHLPSAKLQPTPVLSVPYVPAKELTPVLSQRHDPMKEALPVISIPHLPRIGAIGDPAPHGDVAFSGAHGDVHPGRQGNPRLFRPHPPRLDDSVPFSDGEQDVHPGAILRYQPPNSAIHIEYDGLRAWPVKKDHKDEIASGTIDGLNLTQRQGPPEIPANMKSMGVHPPTQDDPVPYSKWVDEEAIGRNDPYTHPGKQRVIASIRPLRQEAGRPALSSSVYSIGDLHSQAVDDNEVVKRRAMTWDNAVYDVGQAALSTHADLQIGAIKMRLGGSQANADGTPGSIFSTNIPSLESITKNAEKAVLAYAKSFAQGAVNRLTGVIQTGLRSVIYGTPQWGAGVNNFPSKITIKDFPVQAESSVFSYGQDARSAEQAMQQRQADALFDKLAQFNVYNDNNTTTMSDVAAHQSIGDSASEDSLVAAFNQHGNGIRESFIDSFGNRVYRKNQTNAAKNENDQGFIDHRMTSPTDDQTYVPLVFIDLRNTLFLQKSVYFLPFITSLTENFAPQWNMANYFGRVDPVATYQSTSRTINLGFKLVCFSRNDLDVIFKKLAWLTSMCYPQFNDDVYQAGPVVSMRVGDLIASTSPGNGLTGVITSLNLSYDEAIWEIEADAKLPRNIDVTVAFQVLHERPIGLVQQTGGTMFGGVIDSGEDFASADIKIFRAAFGSSEKGNYTSPGSGAAGTHVPNITNQTPLGEPNLPMDNARIFDGVSGIVNGASPSQIATSFGLPNPDGLTMEK